MTCVPDAFTPARSSRSRTGTPRHSVSSFDQRVTQWMSVRTSRWGSAISSSQVSRTSFSTSPKMRRSQLARSKRGFGPTVSTGKRSVRYWPGGTRSGAIPSFSAWRLPRWASIRAVIAMSASLVVQAGRSVTGMIARSALRQGGWNRAQKEYPTQMAYVIAEPCIGTKDNSCVEVCPVDCIHPTPDEAGYDAVEMLYIDPDECIDCDACVEACPVDACFAEDQLPDEWQRFAEINANYYKETAG